MHHVWKRDHLLVSTDPARLDVDAVHAFLSRAYWSVMARGWSVLR